jgi:hypothetical protein
MSYKQGSELTIFVNICAPYDAAADAAACETAPIPPSGYTQPPSPIM